MARKNFSCSSTLFLVLLAVGSFFATYNLLTMAVHYKAVNSLGLSNDPIVEMPDNMKRARGAKALFHVALTATDAPYSKWQCRIMYYWYKKTKDKAGSEMGKFTRILHSGEPDNLMDEIPTFVVDPLPSGLDRGYIVLNRPWAFVQWLERASIEEEYILMAEPDHIFVNPLPNLARGEFPAGFPFFYIKPADNEKIIRKYFPKENGPVTNVDPIGNSPVIIRKDLLEKIAPTWMNVSLRMKDDPETDKTFGWVLEMYAYAVASALHGVQHILRKDFMLQPPWDLETGKRFIIHYTYGCDYTMKGELTYGKIGEWRFDKRSHLRGPPPRNLPLPPPGVPESVVRIVLVYAFLSRFSKFDQEPGYVTGLVESFEPPSFEVATSRYDKQTRTHRANRKHSGGVMGLVAFVSWIVMELELESEFARDLYLDLEFRCVRFT